MADFGENLETEENLLKKHRNERKDLQAHIQKLKNAVPKNDKKRKKELQVEIAKLEAELDEKQEQESKNFHDKNCNSTQTIDNLTDDMVELGTDESNKPDEKKKMSKAQKRRDKKAAKEKDTEEKIKQAEIDNLLGARNIEAEKLKEILSQRNLNIHEIPSDGNCLYSAVVDQLQRLGVQSSIESLRKQTATYLRSNADDFMPFLTNSHTGEPFTNENYESYCNEVESTTAWGGQLELKALSQVLKHPIEIVQADGPCIMIGDDEKAAALILSYHRHIFGLGEHYNSVIIKRSEDDADDGFT